MKDLGMVIIVIIGFIVLGPLMLLVAGFFGDE